MDGPGEITKMISNTLRLGFAAAVLVTSGAANAVLLRSSLPINVFYWSFNTGSYNLNGLGSVIATGFNTSSLSLRFTLTNLSPHLGQGGDRLTSFGFGIDPNATSVVFSDRADGGMINAIFGTLPSKKTVEVCGYGGENCAGGGNGGIRAFAFDTFTIVLGGQWGSSVNLEPIALRYQTHNGSFVFTTSTSTSTSSGNLAEPATSSMALLALGLLGMALRRESLLGQH
ncbi:MAG: PEP-CTERM sorting domain-containing protein [Gammaproteobacteria bacterium]|nr:PEP-CTERM sorting domain-containing protein [Gammaproteobacteria bacterium]